MHDWWVFSPYYDAVFYLPGAPSHRDDRRYTAAWVATASGQGWGLIPTWAGFQSNCACDPTRENRSTAYLSCHRYPNQIGPDLGGVKQTTCDPKLNPDNATNQGICQADAAIKAAVTSGFDGSIVYLDVEQFAPTDACSASVRAYLSAYVTEMHNLGASAGVYGSASNVTAAFGPENPDDIWIAKYDNRATVWGLGTNAYVLDDSNWPNKQRIHQYHLDADKSGSPAPEKWGGTSLAVDRDLVDAAIDLGAVSNKPIGPLTLNPVAPPGAEATELFGIDNGVNNTSGFTPGTAAGVSFLQYDANNPYQEGDPVAEGFTWSAGTAAVLPALQGSTFGTQPYAINNLGIAVGNWNYPDGSRFPGFVYDAKSNKFLTQDIDSGAYFTILSGINDAGWIVGEVVPSEGDAASCALFKPGSSSGTWTPTLFSPPDGSGCGTVGINGIGLVVGYSANDTPFAYDLEAGDPQNAAPLSVLSGYSGIYPWSINNNGVITGEVGGTGGFILNDGEYLTLSGEVAFGVNDDLEFVGTANEQGFILETPH